MATEIKMVVAYGGGEWLSGGIGKLSGGIEMLYILIYVLVTQIYMYLYLYLFIPVSLIYIYLKTHLTIP